MVLISAAAAAVVAVSAVPAVYRVFELQQVAIGYNGPDSTEPPQIALSESLLPKAQRYPDTAHTN